MTEDQENPGTKLKQQCSKLVGNITRFLEFDDPVTEKFIMTVRQIETYIEREYYAVVPPWASHLPVKRALDKLDSAYEIAKSLAKEFRWVTRMRITERGKDCSRVNLDKNKSIVITLEDLNLDKPLLKIISVTVDEVAEDAEKLISKSTPSEIQE